MCGEPWGFTNEVPQLLWHGNRGPWYGRSHAHAGVFPTSQGSSKAGVVRRTLSRCLNHHLCRFFSDWAPSPGTGHLLHVSPAQARPRRAARPPGRPRPRPPGPAPRAAPAGRPPGARRRARPRAAAGPPRAAPPPTQLMDANRRGAPLSLMARSIGFGGDIPLPHDIHQSGPNCQTLPRLWGQGLPPFFTGNWAAYSDFLTFKVD